MSKEKDKPPVIEKGSEHVSKDRDKPPVMGKGSEHV